MALKHLLILGLFPLALAMVTQNVSQMEQLFEKFESDFGKKYKSLEERSQRFINFANNVQEMERFNQVQLFRSPQVQNHHLNPPPDKKDHG